MLDQIKKSGLENQTKVAQELVKELETYIKSAGMNKRADLTLFSGDDLKNLFVYWATASCLKLQEQGEASLQGMTIPEIGTMKSEQIGPCTLIITWRASTSHLFTMT